MDCTSNVPGETLLFADMWIYLYISIFEPGEVITTQVGVLEEDAVSFNSQEWFGW